MLTRAGVLVCPEATQIGGWCIASVAILVHSLTGANSLGHTASICVCDNGSTDGTAEALRRLESDPAIPLHLILNPKNRGNSAGRNQIIDHVLHSGADYVLFMDGDIEIVPFFKLRHVASHGKLRAPCSVASAPTPAVSHLTATA